MAPESLEERVVRLEGQMTELRDLPRKVDDLGMQVSQLRAEMRGEFSAVRSEMAGGFAAVRSEMAEGLAAVRGEMAEGLAAVRGETAEGLATVGTQMRVLHEDVINRIGLLQEALPTRPARRKKR